MTTTADGPVLDDRILGYLREAVFVRVATVTPHGRPHVAPFWFATDGVRIVISTLRNQTIRNLEVNADAAVLVDLGTDFRDLRGAHIRGQAVLRLSAEPLPAAVQALHEEIDRIHAAEITEPEFARYSAWETRTGTSIEIVPESATWFDLGHAQAGRTGAPTAKGST